MSQWSYLTRTGKSNTSKIIILYDIYKMCCLGENIWKFFGLIPRPFFVGIAHKSMDQAWKNVNELVEWIDQCPWFIEQKKDPNSLFNMFQFGAVKNSSNFIGTNMPLFWMTECNFFPIDLGTAIINDAINRVQGSFETGFDIFQHIILDSSDTSVDSVVPTFLKKNPFGRRAMQYRFSRYEVHADRYYGIEDTANIDMDQTYRNSLGEVVNNPYYGKPSRTFTVYKGDSEIHPTIMPPYSNTVVSQDSIKKMDPDKFIKVPLELLDNAKSNIEVFLMDICGQAVEATAQYFNPQYVVPRFNITNLVHEQNSHDPADVVCVDFFNPEDTFIELFREAVEALPKDRCIFVSIDLGLVTDRTGFCIGYVQDLNAKNVDGVLAYDPLIKIPIAVGISRYEGQQTSIDKLCDLIQWIHSIVPIYMVRTDTFQSFIIQQRCESLKIPHCFLSVDRDYGPYQTSKQELYMGKVDISENKVLKTEMLNVYDTGKKIDHHEVMNDAQEIGSDSKDILDSVCGCITMIMREVAKDAEAVMAPPLVSNSQAQAYNTDFMEKWIKEQQLQRAILSRQMQYGI